MKNTHLLESFLASLGSSTAAAFFSSPGRCCSAAAADDDDERAASSCVTGFSAFSKESHRCLGRNRGGQGEDNARPPLVPDDGPLESVILLILWSITKQKHLYSLAA